MINVKHTNPRISLLEHTRRMLAAQFPTAGYTYIDHLEVMRSVKAFWHSLSNEDRQRLASELERFGYEQDPLSALKVWAYECLRLEDAGHRNPPSPTRREWWPGKPNGFISAGSPGLGRRR